MHYSYYAIAPREDDLAYQSTAVADIEAAAVEYRMTCHKTIYGKVIILEIEGDSKTDCVAFKLETETALIDIPVKS